MSMPQKVKKEEDSGEETIGPEEKKNNRRDHCDDMNSKKKKILHYSKWTVILNLMSFRLLQVCWPDLG